MSREASLARSVTPFRYSVTSATCESGLAGLRSSESSTSMPGEVGHLLGHLLEPLLDALAKLVGDRAVAALDLDLHGGTSLVVVLAPDGGVSDRLSSAVGASVRR